MSLYPPIEPYEQGMLDVGDGNRIFWETCGNPAGKPAVVLHGGPGSGCTPGWRRYFNPAAYRLVLFDQRGCGRSTPHASDPATSLTSNTTQHLLADIELLRGTLGIERWLVFGGSWGSTLGLAYAEQHPDRVSALVLFSVVTTTRMEVEWVTRAMRRYFPDAWARFRDGLSADQRDGSFVDAYAELLNGPDLAAREQAAIDWCAWEDTHVAVTANHQHDTRYDDPHFRMAFARLVTHYWRHAAFLPDGQLLRDAEKLNGIPGALIHGRLDISSPLDIAWEIARRWHDADLVLIDDAGHGSSYPNMQDALIAATDRFVAS
jgi:proline iminopeptidase